MTQPGCGCALTCLAATPKAPEMIYSRGVEFASSQVGHQFDLRDMLPQGGQREDPQKQEVKPARRACETEAALAAFSSGDRPRG